MMAMMVAHHKDMMSIMKSERERTEANQEKLEASPGKIEAAAEHQDIPNEAATMETIGALEDRSEDQLLSVGYRNPLKRSTNDSVV
jgi:hypothetical protein